MINIVLVIRASVEGTSLIGSDRVMSLSIKQILKNKSDLRLRTNATLILWTEGEGCQSECPAVRKRKEYIIACSKKVNADNGRLMFDTNTCMISRWKNKWTQAIAVRKILLDNSLTSLGKLSKKSCETEKKIKSEKKSSETEILLRWILLDLLQECS